MLFIAHQNRHRPALWAACLAIAIANHEAGLFALPGMTAIALLQDRGFAPRATRLALAAATVLPAVLMKAWLRRQINTDFPLDASDYLTIANITHNVRALIPTGALGIFMTFKLLWCLPLLAIAQLWQRREKGMALAIALMIAGPLAQLLIAEDATRLMALAFPAVLLSAQTLRRTWGDPCFTRRLWILILLSLAIPTATVWGPQVLVFHPLPIVILAQYLFELPL